MNEIVTLAGSHTPALVAAAGDRASMLFLEFFAANVRNPHTRGAYYRAEEEFPAWCASAGMPSIAGVRPVHVQTWIEALTRELAAPSDKHGWLTARSCRQNPKRHAASKTILNGSHQVAQLTKLTVDHGMRLEDTKSWAQPSADRRQMIVRPAETKPTGDPPLNGMAIDRDDERHVSKINNEIDFM